MAWIATMYGHNGYTSDEWGVISRVAYLTSWLREAFAGTNGHLMVPTFVVYWLQKSWLGVGGHQLVWLVFCLSLGCLQLSIALLLHRLGMSTLIALLAATVVTYFGAGAHDMTWEFQLGVNFALAVSFGAAFVALGRSRSLGTAAAIAALLVLAVAFDSGLAVFGAVYVGMLLAFLWPRRLTAVALGPPLVAHLGWIAFGTGASYQAESLRTMASFAAHLFTLAAGGLVGGGETKRAVGIAVGASPRSSPTIPMSGEAVGVIALGLATLCVAYGFARHRYSRQVGVNFVAGLTTALVTVAFLAKTRAYLPPVILPASGARFIQWVAIFLLIAFAPAITDALRLASPPLRQWGGIGAAGMLVTVFILNLGQLWPVLHFQEAWATNIRSDVRQTITLLHEDCGARHHPNAGFPNGGTLDVVTVKLIQELLRQGALSERDGIPASKQVRATICSPAAGTPADRSRSRATGT
jgi:hypothetical protein